MAKPLIGVLLILLCVVGTAWAGGDEAALKARSHAWIKAFNAGDAKALASIYTTDGKLLPPNSEFVQGRESIEAYWAPFIVSAQGELEIQEAFVQGDHAYLLGTFKILDKGGKVIDRGKYIEIWKWVREQWGLYRDIWNTSLPPSEPATP
jgi:uncharacterized protein (TIGR02246 family)